MRQSAFLILILISFLPSVAQEKTDSLIERYSKASKEEKVLIANSLAEAFKEDADTLYVYNKSDDMSLMDYNTYYYASEYYNRTGCYNQAADCIAKAISICEQKRYDDDSKGSCYSLASVINLRLCNFDEAIEYSEKVIEIDRKSGSREDMSSDLNTLAGIYMTSENYSKAMEYALLAIETERGLGRDNILPIRLGMASEISLKMRRIDDALRYAKEAYEIEKRNNNPSKLAIRESQLAQAYLEKGMLDEALFLSSSSITQFQKDGNLNSLSIAYIQMGIILERKDNLQNAIKYLELGADLTQKTGNRYLENNAHKILYRILKKSDSTGALYHLEKCMELSDSIYTEKSLQTLNRFNAKFENIQNRFKIERQQQELKTSRILLFIACVVLLLCVVAIVLLIKIAKEKNDRNRILVKTNLLKDKLLAVAKAHSETGGKATSEIKEVAEEISTLGNMPDIKLTKREIEVIRHCCEGKISKEIAICMGISQRTVDTHKNNIFKKLGINTTVELVTYAHKAGIY